MSSERGLSYRINRQIGPRTGIGWIRPEDRQAAEDDKWLQLPDGELPALGDGK